MGRRVMGENGHASIRCCLRYCVNSLIEPGQVSYMTLLVSLWVVLFDALKVGQAPGQNVEIVGIDFRPVRELILADVRVQ